MQRIGNSFDFLYHQACILSDVNKTEAYFIHREVMHCTTRAILQSETGFDRTETGTKD